MIYKTKTLENNNQNILLVAKKIKAGNVIALPTETVYGLAGRFDNDLTIKKIFSIKNRPLSNPLIIHYGSIENALEDIYMDSRAKILAEKFWPGPLTIVAKAKNKLISKIATSGLDTVAIRVPSNKIALAVLNQFNLPFAAPSANRYGKISPTSAKDVFDELNGKVTTILNGGTTKFGIESTVIDISNKKTKILRHGGISEESINQLIKIHNKENNILIRSPGLSNSHYKPDKPIRINATRPREGEAWLAFGKKPSYFKGISLTLSEKKCLDESAKNLYKMLRLLDKKNVKSVAIQKIPEKGIGLAINDRLRRAAFIKDK
jgi:L-threonylcarbamoyladenylate synthase